MLLTEPSTFATPHEDGLFLNSIPKAGTVMLNNIVQQFTGLGPKIVNPWLTPGTMNDPAFKDVQNKFLVGHLPFNTHSWFKARNYKQLLLVRNPRDVCLAYVRFYASEEMLGRSKLTDFISAHRPDPSVILRSMLAGWEINGEKHPPVLTVWRDIIRWAHLPNVLTIPYEALTSHIAQCETAKAEQFFAAVLAHGGIDLCAFSDWRERVAAGGARDKSQTASENLTSIVPMAGFPSAADLAMIDLEYGPVPEAYWDNFVTG